MSVSDGFVDGNPPSTTRATDLSNIDANRLARLLMRIINSQAQIMTGPSTGILRLRKLLLNSLKRKSGLADDTLSLFRLTRGMPRTEFNSSFVTNGSTRLMRLQNKLLNKKRLTTSSLMLIGRPRS